MTATLRPAGGFMVMILIALLLTLDAERMEWKVDGVAREALVVAGAREAAPVVFAFHGHGGSMQNAARSFAIEKHWPEAVVVYPQGLPTVGRLTDPEGKQRGWQHGIGEQGDRDLRFFDAMLTTIKERHKIDEKRVYAMGHSNGGQFTCLLGGSRREVLAAIAPSAAAGARFVKEPCPILHVMGRKDPLVTPAMQERSIAAMKTLNACEEQGKDWDKDCLIYASPKDAPLVTFIHDGDHKYPSEAPALIVKFFKQNARK